MIVYLPLLIMVFGPAILILWLAWRQLRLTAQRSGASIFDLRPSWSRAVIGRALTWTLIGLVAIIVLSILLRTPLIGRAVVVLPWIFAMGAATGLVRWQESLK
jgi:hypothetical protein